MMASSKGWIPLFFKELPQRTGTIDPFKTASLKNILSSFSEIDSSERYFSIKASSCSAAASRSCSWHAFASFKRSSGISVTSNLCSSEVLFQMTAFIATRSITPSKLFSAPMGSCMGIALAPNLFFIISMALKKSAPILSILFIKAILGTLYLSA